MLGAVVLLYGLVLGCCSAPDYSVMCDELVLPFAAEEFVSVWCL